MTANLKKVLLNTVYYTLIGAMVAFVVFFFISLANSSMADWERILFFVLVSLLVVVVIYDIYCTYTRSQKYIAGFILYAITIAIIVFTLIVMAINSSNGRLILDITDRFFRIILFTYLINAFAVIIYLTGEKLITHASNRAKK